MDYYQKYLQIKSKYLLLKELEGGGRKNVKQEEKKN